MAKSTRGKKVVKMKRRPPVLAGLLLLLLSVYMIVLFVQTLTREHISIGEVTETEVADDENIRGIILRDEKLITTKKSGYINYYVGEGSRVGNITTVYSIDQDGRFSNLVASMDTSDFALSTENTREIRSDIANYRNDFDLSDYHKITNFKYNIENTLLRMTTVDLLDHLDQYMRDSVDLSSLKLVKAKKSGVISFCSDGLEDLTISTLTTEHFSNMKDNWNQLRKTEMIEAGTPVYKLVTSEKWSVVLPLTQEQYEKIYDKDSVNVTIKKDNLQMRPSVSTFTIDGSYYAKLDFSKYMIRYLENRYLDVQIEFNGADGLKIPTSSILSKKFYLVPSEYITQGGSSGNKGVMLQTYKEDGTTETTFQETDVYYEDESGKCYINADLFEVGATIVKGTSTGTVSMQLSEIGELEGVYNCNQGYCVFRRIEKLYENEEYAVVAKDTSFGLSTYDHIILNPDMIGEDEIIY